MNEINVKEMFGLAIVPEQLSVTSTPYKKLSEKIKSSISGLLVTPKISGSLEKNGKELYAEALSKLLFMTLKNSDAKGFFVSANYGDFFTKEQHEEMLTKNRPKKYLFDNELIVFCETPQCLAQILTDWEAEEHVIHSALSVEAAIDFVKRARGASPGFFERDLLPFKDGWIYSLKEEQIITFVQMDKEQASVLGLEERIKNLINNKFKN